MADMEVRIETDNTEAVKALLEAGIVRALEAVGLQAEGYAKRKCPVDTGNLRNSITHMVSSDTVYIGTNVEYAAYVEYGHSQEVGRYVPALGARLKQPFVKARPFLKPALNDHIPEYKSIIEEYIKG